MKTLIVLLHRDWLDIKKKIISLIVIWSTLPMFLHLFLGIPFSKVIITDIRYLNWAAPGIWVCSSSMIAFMITFSRMKKMRFDSNQLNTLLKAPISNGHIILSVITRGIILGWIQSCFAMTLTIMINNEFISGIQILIILLQIFLIVIFFSILGTLFGNIIKDNLIMVFITLILFLFLALGMGAFIPMNLYPENYISIVSNIPISGMISNFQSIIQNEVYPISNIILTLILNLVLGLITLALSYQTFRK